MHVGLIGTHGVGKTTVFERLKPRRPDAHFFSSPVRHQMKAFGLGHPFDDVCKTYGIGALELLNVSAWSVIDPVVNSALTPGRLVMTDRSVIDNVAYHLAMRANTTDTLLEPLVLSIARYHASLYDAFVYFPCDAFPLVGDARRPASVALQRSVDACVLAAITKLGVPAVKIHRLQAIDVDARVEEILGLLPAP